MNLFNAGFPDLFELNIGKYAELFIDYLMTNWTGFFYAIRSVLSSALLSMEQFLMGMPALIFILAVFLLACFLVSWKSGIVFSVMLIIIGLMGYWKSMMFTLSIVFSSVAIAIVLGILLGVLLTQSNIIRTLLHPILDALQTTPTFVYLLPGIMLFGLGKVPAVFVTIIYTIAPVVRLTYLGISQVPKEMVVVADAFGCTKLQKLIKVQLPQALPMIAAGINQTTLMSLSMVVVTSMIGAKGLGLDILTAISFIDIADAFEVGICVIFLAIILDRMTQGIANKFRKKYKV